MGCKWTELTTWQALKNRTVILYPDLGAYWDWKERAKFIGFNVHISDLLYLAAMKEQLDEGLDMADFFWRIINKNIHFSPLICFYIWRNLPIIA